MEIQCFEMSKNELKEIFGKLFSIFLSSRSQGPHRKFYISLSGIVNYLKRFLLS